MSANGGSPTNPHNNGSTYHPGMTKREDIAKHILSGLCGDSTLLRNMTYERMCELSGDGMDKVHTDETRDKVLVAVAVRRTDALLAELEKDHE